MTHVTPVSTDSTRLDRCTCKGMGDRELPQGGLPWDSDSPPAPRRKGHASLPDVQGAFRIVVLDLTPSAMVRD